VSHGFAGMHSAPGVQATQFPELQTRPVPHAAPFVTGVVVWMQTDVPVLQLVVQTFPHEPAGVQSTPAAQGTQVPAPSHTAFVPQPAPATSGVVVGTQVGWLATHWIASR